jgi:RNA polymerase sigma-B factor
MQLILNTNVSSLDEPGHNSDRGSEPNIAAIKSLQYEALLAPDRGPHPAGAGFGGLSELQRKVVYLFFYKDLSQTEIGRRLGFPQRKISRIIASATRTLKKRLSERER